MLKKSVGVYRLLIGCALVVLLLFELRVSAENPLTLTPRFAFTGVRTTSQIATVVHCTNPNADPITVSITVYQWNNGFNYSTEQAISTGNTITASFDTTGVGTLLYSEDANVQTTNSIGQGRGVISVNPPNAPIYCVAQLLDATSSKPSFVVDLPLVPISATGIPTAIGLTQLKLAEQPLWQVVGLAGLVIVAGFVSWRLRRGQPDSPRSARKESSK